MKPFFNKTNFLIYGMIQQLVIDTAEIENTERNLNIM